MKIKAICCLGLLIIIGAVAVSQTVASVQPSAPKTGPRPNCGPIKKSITDWPQFGFVPSHTGYNPYESILGPATVGNLALKWENQFSAPPYYLGLTSMAVVNGVAYFGSQNANDGTGYVYALNASNGCLLWEYKADSYVEGTPAVVNGVVYAATGFNVYALNASTGALIWESGRVGGYSPTVANGVVYGCDYLTVYALDAGTGALLWQYTPGTGIYTPPAVANGAVYFGSNGGSVYALDAGTGAPLWQYSTGEIYVDSSPVVANGVVYVGATANEGYLYALDAGTGTLIWKYNVGGDSHLAVANGVVYVGTNGYYMYALDAGTGALIWESGSGGNGPLIVANGLVYVVAGNVYALDAGTGAALWNYPADGANSPPTVSDGVVYTVGNYGEVFAFSLPNQ
jgi:outer membrane protein assembly factor BamB